MMNQEEYIIIVIIIITIIIIIIIITEINNKQIYDSEDIDIVMYTYNLIEYTAAYSKTSGSLWQYYRDKTALDHEGKIIDFAANNNNSISFKFKQ